MYLSTYQTVQWRPTCGGSPPRPVHSELGRGARRGRGGQPAEDRPRRRHGADRGGDTGTVHACGGRRSSRTWRPSSRPVASPTSVPTWPSSRAPSAPRSPSRRAPAHRSVDRYACSSVAPRWSRASWSTPRRSGCCWLPLPCGARSSRSPPRQRSTGSSRTAAPAPGAVESRLGLGHALRALARDRAVVRVRAGEADLTGRIERVGADHLDLADVDGGRRGGWAVAFATLRVVQTG